MYEYKKIKKALVKKFGYPRSSISLTRGRGTVCMSVYIKITKPFGFNPTISEICEEHYNIMQVAKSLDKHLNYSIRFLYPNGRIVRGK